MSDARFVRNTWYVMAWSHELGAEGTIVALALFRRLHEQTLAAEGAPA
jgi:hypothetical protein